MDAGTGFGEYHKRLLGREFDEFIEHLFSHQARKSIRVNTLKASVVEVEDFLSGRRIEYAEIPWCKLGRWVPASTELDAMEHQLGWFFIQEAASMAPAEALAPKAGELVLDLCAAPGAKTTQIAAAMENRGVLAANDDNFTRIRALVYNIQRCGAANALVVKKDGVGFEKLDLKFDKVLVDAPCSSVGTGRKNPEVLKAWSLARVERLAGLQKKLVSSAFKCLAEGGALVYSTCTTTREENEGVVEHLLDEFDSAKLADVKLPGLKHVDGLTPKTRKCVRLLPQHNDTESYFIAKVVKNG